MLATRPQVTLFDRCRPDPFSTWRPADASPGVGYFVRISGDEMTGPLILYADPTVDPQAVTKRYCDMNSRFDRVDGGWY